MIKPYTIGMFEKYDAFLPAKAKADVKNYVFGDIDANGEFEVGADKSKIVMTIVEDDRLYRAFNDENNKPFKAGTDLRVADLTKWVGKYLQISNEHLPDTFDVGNKLTSNAEGLLEVNAGAGGLHLEIVEIYLYAGKKAVLAKIVA